LLTLAAAEASLDLYREGRVIPRLWKSGKIIFDNFTALIERRGLTSRMRLIGYPVRQQIVFRDREGQPSYALSGLFQQEMAKRGVLSYAGLGFSFAHTDDELLYTVAAFDETLDVLAKAIEVDDPGRFLEGRPPEPVFRALRDKAQTSN
jgi:4-aminobutyrate aminotransferase-like enzyme